MSKIADLSPDPRNANKGTDRGLDMLKTSLREYGAGRSLLLDKHGVVIAGNKTLEAAASVGIERVRVVETDGTEIIAVKRIDLDLSEDARAKALAVADNRVAEIGLSWDAEVLDELSASHVELSHLFTNEELALIVLDAQDAMSANNHQSNDEDQPSPSGAPVISYTIVFDNELQQADWFDFLKRVKADYSGHHTIASRIMQFVKDRS